ncbi:MAG: hypothetical protein ABL864_00955 [Terricaulis sp.]
MRSIVFCLALFGLVACATPYQESGFTGGVTAAPLGGDTYRISARLNAYSDQTMVQDYLLLRAAETALAQGAIGFVILDARDNSRTGTYVAPGSSTTTATVNTFGNTAYGTANTTYTPAQAYNFVHPGGILLIGLVRQHDPNLRYFNAQEISTAIGPRVRRGGN